MPLNKVLSNFSKGRLKVAMLRDVVAYNGRQPEMVLKGQASLDVANKSFRFTCSYPLPNSRNNRPPSLSNH